LKLPRSTLPTRGTASEAPTARPESCNVLVWAPVMR
jgi:hypothetical protein